MVNIFIYFFVNTIEALCIYIFENQLLFSLFVFFVFQSEIFHEAEVMMKLDHPNIVRIIGTCTTMLLCIVYSFCTYSEVILSDTHDVHVLSMW